MIVIIFLLAAIFAASADWEAVDIVASTASGIKVFGDYVFVADEDTGIHIINSTVPEVLRSTAMIQIPGSCMDVMLGPNPAEFIYVTCLESGFHKIDVSNPRNPSLTQSVHATGMQMGGFRGKHAFVADQQNGLVIIDMNLMSVVTVIPLSGRSSLVAISGNAAYVVNTVKGIVTVNISKVESAAVIGSYSPNISVSSCAVASSGHLYVSGDGELNIVDISTAETPTLIRSIKANTATRITFQGDHGYLSDSKGGMKIISNTSIPADVVVTDSSLSPKWLVSEIQISDGVAYLATNTEGVISARHTPVYPTVSANGDVWPSVLLGRQQAVAGNGGVVSNFPDFGDSTNKVAVHMPTQLPISGTLNFECGHYSGCDCIISLSMKGSQSNTTLLHDTLSSGWAPSCAHLRLNKTGEALNMLSFSKKLPAGKSIYKLPVTINYMTVMVANGVINALCV
eukprot:TRINITY_DN17962_c0_g1_i1.p1 TRINITY_DN17962_c0_g1~~TRINITY_DN17962_c0_g1_i1.p1  ORF type:complete len:455 (+),score=52.51 TRINITY_DN17962_c0_g1_i1:80-1444(+)